MIELVPAQVDAFFNSTFFQSVFVFYLLVIVVFGLLGVLTRTTAVASMSAYMVFAVLATETRDLVLLTAFFAVTIAFLVYLGFTVFTFSAGGGDL